MRHVFIVLTTFSVFFYACSSEPAKNTNVSKEQVAINNAVSELKASAIEVLPILLKRFDFEEDKVEGGGWYHHKLNKNKNITHIEVPVCTNGYFYLKTNYCGKDWIFHDHIILNIAGDIYKTKIYIRTLENTNFVEKFDFNGVFESLHLENRDAGFIAYLITFYDKNAISVRLKGDGESKDIILSNEDKSIIRDCYLLSQFLTVTKNTAIESIVLDKNKPDEFYLVPKDNEPSTAIKKTI